MTRPRLVPVKLRDLDYGAEFTSVNLLQHGTVVTTGYVMWRGDHGTQTRVRAVQVRYAGGVVKNHLAEMFVLVDAERKHVRFDPATDGLRWSQLLEEPGTLGTLGQVARRT
jgi:hypothetical protein